MMQQDGVVIAVQGGAGSIDIRDIRRIRGPLWGGMDRRIFVVAAISLCIHLGLLYAIHRIVLPPASPVALEKISDRFVKFIIEKPLPKTDAKAEKTALSSETKQAAANNAGEPAQTAAGASAGAGPVTTRQRAVAANAARVEQKIRTVGVLGMLTGVGATARGPSVVNILGKTGKESAVDLEGALSKMNGIAKAQNIEVLDRKLVKSKDLSVNPREEITDLVAGITTAKSAELSKRGNFVIQRPEAIEGAASTSAKRDNDAINAVVGSHKASIRMTYEKYLQRDPSLAGKVTVRFTIAASGKVTKVEILENSTGNADLEQEIVRKVRMWEFEPVPEGDVTVTYPFLFSLS